MHVHVRVRVRERERAREQEREKINREITNKAGVKTQQRLIEIKPVSYLEAACLPSPETSLLTLLYYHDIPL